MIAQLCLLTVHDSPKLELISLSFMMTGAQLWSAEPQRITARAKEPNGRNYIVMKCKVRN